MSKVDRKINEKPFQSEMAEITFIRTYSKLKKNGNKEKWEETVYRYINFIEKRLEGKISFDKLQKIYNAILRGEVMPSMRMMQFAGKHIDKNEVSAYNCSFVNVDNIKALTEILYLNMSGVGVGFGIEKEVVDKLPFIKKSYNYVSFKYPVLDSVEGWVKAYFIFLRLKFDGWNIDFDLSRIRPKFSIVSRGGYSCGPEGFTEIINTCKEIMENATSRKMKPIEVMDLICSQSASIHDGAARRIALISFSDLNDTEVRDAKKGQFWLHHPNRRFSNNSVKYYNKPSRSDFEIEWQALKDNQTGERGIFNVKNIFPERRKYSDNRKGGNPCAEIGLLSAEFCNLSEVVLRPEDDFNVIKEKIKLATLIGTWQSTLTNFNLRMLRKQWKDNCDKERLLGVSITGIADNLYLIKNFENLDEILKKLKKIAISVNAKESDLIGINRSAAITCIKPSGSVSTIMDTAPGLHPRFSDFYIRRIRFHQKEETLLKLAGFETFKDPYGTGIYVEFPIKSPDNSWLQNNITAIEQLEIWKKFKMSYCEHNPSMTCYIKVNEWDLVKEWIWDNWNFIAGISFLPYSDHIYKAAPYEAISKEKYEEMKANSRSKNWNILYERSKDTRSESTGCDNQSH